ncbi:MAG: hypothetical protein C0594_10325 [Marinilabiliales bacterium]|nr:MAG: hypothetical protein C0594_10325 [Marinilabiliales bacterium]
MSSSLNNIGEVYRALGDYDRALYNLTEAMRISQNVGDMRGLSKAIGNLGLTYEKKGDFNMAEEYYNQSLKIKAKINDKYGEAISFISLAQLYIKKAKYEKAIDFCEKGLALSTEINAKDLQKDAYKTLSEIYEQLKEYDKSLRYHKAYSELKDSLISYNAQERIARFQSQFETLETEKENEILKKDKLLREAKLKYQQDEIRKKNQISYIFFFIAFVFLVFLIIVIRQNISKKKINKTLEFKNFEISQQNEEISQQKEEIQAINEKLEDINSELEKQSIVAKQTDNAVLILSPEGNIEWVNSYLLEKYNLSFKQLVKETSGTIFNYSSHTDIKSIFLSCIKEKKTVLYETYTSIGDFWAQTTLTPILDENGNVSKLIAIDTDISKLKMAYSEIDKKNDLLNAKNIQITDSIAYAKKIQEAILPTVQIIQEQLPESFIFYKPKDIVSGDFYWFSEQKERIFLACVDCTGHGVPGAFMSIIGSNILDDLINDKKLSNPSEILQEMHKRVRRTLNISGSDISQDDGMDMMICCINKDERELSIAGANQYAYIIRNQEIQTISGGIYSIGEKTRDNIPPVYETNHFMIDQDTYVYMFSDGYQDQFGGDKNRKFMASNFKKLLYDNHSLGFDNQADVISQNFSNWKRDKKQIDDVLVVGFKLSPELL